MGKSFGNIVFIVNTNQKHLMSDTLRVFTKVHSFLVTNVNFPPNGTAALVNTREHYMRELGTDTTVIYVIKSMVLQLM